MYLLLITLQKTNRTKTFLREQSEKLLAFAKPNDIKKALGTQQFYTLLATMEIQLGRKPKLSEIKKYLKENQQFLKPLLTNQEFLQKYAAAVEKRNSPEGLQTKEKIKSLSRPWHCLESNIKDVLLQS